MRASRRRTWTPGPRQAVERALFRNRLYRLSLRGRVPDELAALPGDPWTGDTTRGVRMLDGIWSFAGQTFVSRDGPPWYPEDAAPGWLEAMHGFAWLRDSREVGQAARELARAAVASWISRCAAWHGVTWRADVVARRLLSWLTNAAFLFNGADVAFRRRFLASLAEQARHLARIARGAPDGVPRFATLTGLAVVELALPSLASRLPATLRGVEAELKRQILADGGHVSRNPSALFAVMRDATMLRAALAAAGRDAPDGLNGAIEHTAPMLRFFRHGDGGLALFNGGTEDEPSAIGATLALARSVAKPASHAPASGYARLVGGATTLIVDAGGPAPGLFGAGAHAGIASFELSVGTDRVIVNCGGYEGPDESWSRAMRATAAHSTLTVDDTNACELLPDGMGRVPVAVGAERFEADGASGIEIRHDGYRARFKLDHVRRLTLAEDGLSVLGEERLNGPGGERWTLRFHLHPSVSVALVEDGTAALFRLPSGAGWRLVASDGILSLGESVYLGRRGEARRSWQIAVVGGLNGTETVVRWTLAALGARKGRALKDALAPEPRADGG